MVPAAGAWHGVNVVKALLFKALGNFPLVGGLRLRLGGPHIQILSLQGTGTDYVTTMGERHGQRGSLSHRVLHQGFSACQHTLKLYPARKIFKALPSALGFFSRVCRVFREGGDHP